jgi:hypothetical protein
VGSIFLPRERAMSFPKQATFLFLIALGIFSATASAATFTNNFDMDGNYTQYLYSTQNAQVWNEIPSFPDVFYWAPINNNQLAYVTYLYQFSAPITDATVFANMYNFPGSDPASQVELDVSTNDVNWHSVGTGYLGEGSLSSPIDIGSIVDGSTTVYVRGDMYESTNFGNIHYAQFLRTANGAPNQAPNVYQFQATTAVPEPNSIVILSSGLFFICKRRYRNFIKKTPV